MKTGNRVRIAAGIAIVLLVASAIATGMLSLELKVTVLEGRVASLENKTAELERRMTTSPVRMVPCK